MSCELGVGEAKTSRGAGGRWRRSQTPEPADQGPGRRALKVRPWAGAPRGGDASWGWGLGGHWNGTQLGFLEARGVPVLPGAPDRPRHWVSVRGHVQRPCLTAALTLGERLCRRKRTASLLTVTSPLGAPLVTSWQRFTLHDSELVPGNGTASSCRVRQFRKPEGSGTTVSPEWGRP